MSQAAHVSEAPPIYTTEELGRLDKRKIPHHIALIPDGNRRWARKRAMNAQEGHWQGADSLIEIVKGAKELGVQALTIFGFSTENHTRTQAEVDAVMYIMEHYLTAKREDMAANGIRCCSIGDVDHLRPDLRDALMKTRAATAHCSDIDFVLALNYGGRDDIKRACQKVAEECRRGEIDPSAITEEMISGYLDTSEWTDPDLLIRTSGEMRISNFLLWQCSYAEIYTSELLWPDFTPKHLLEAVLCYQQRKRRLGT